MHAILTALHDGRLTDCRHAAEHLLEGDESVLAAHGGLLHELGVELVGAVARHCYAIERKAAKRAPETEADDHPAPKRAKVCDLEQQLLAAAQQVIPADLSWASVAGCHEAKQALHDAVLLPALRPELFQARVLRAPGTVLLYGPPGTGKTHLARATAGELQLRGVSTVFLMVSPSSLLSKWTGESERLVAALFRLAQRLDDVVVVFIDELDSLASSRSRQDTDSNSRRVLTELLVQLSRLEQLGSAGRVIVMAATNRPAELDAACVRRFQHRVSVDLPPPEARAELLRIHLADVDHCVTEHELVELAGEPLDGMTGADIALLVRDAALAPIREAFSQAAQVRAVNVDDLRTAAHKGAGGLHASLQSLAS